MLEDQCWTEFVFGESFAAEYSRVMEHFQQFGFASGCPLDGLTLVGRSAHTYVVDANATSNAFERGVRRFPVLIAGPFVDQAIQNIVANFSASLGRTDAGLLDGLCDKLSRWAIVCAVCIRLEPIAFTAFDGRHDS